jgi:hypothetical protein
MRLLIQTDEIYNDLLVCEMERKKNMEFKFNEVKTWLEDDNGKQIALLDHPDKEQQKAQMLAGPACGLKR